MNYYQTSKRQYHEWCRIYNDIQVPVVYRDFLYEHLKLSQPQARVFHHFVYLRNDQDTEFHAAQFRGIAGIGMREKIPAFLDELKIHLKQSNPHFRNFYYDIVLREPHYYRLHVEVDQTAFKDVNSLTDWEDVELVPLSPEPAKLPDLKGRRRKTTEKSNDPRPEDLEPESTPHMKELIDYLHSRRVSYNLNKLAKQNGFDLKGVRIIYEPKLKTDRFFSDGRVLNDRYGREELFHGCYIIDISNAQLSIIAKLWNLPKVTAFLQSEGKIWDVLTKISALDKGTVKDFLYAAIYGMLEDDLQRYYGSKLLAHELIVELINARNSEIQQITNGKPLTTAFGDVLRASSFEQAKSVLSTQVQSYEQAIVLHAFKEHIVDSKDVVMVGYLFDGFFVKFVHNEKYAMSMIKRIEDSMTDKGNEFGMHIKCSNELVVDEFRQD